MLPEWGRFMMAVKLNRGFSLADELLDNLTKQVALLAQQYKTQFPQTNNQLRTSSNTQNQAIVQNGRVVVQNVQGRQNKVQGNNARGVGAAGNEGAQNRADEGLVQDMAQNVDNIFQADQCDTFDSDVDEAPTAQTLFMANLSSADPVYNEAGLLYDFGILSEVQDHDNCLDIMNDSHKEHEMHNDDNKDQVVHSDVSSVPNDAIMIITNDIYEQDAQCVTSNKPNNTVITSLTAELARYKELADIYEKGPNLN
ncbi:hypothetical protein Tco_0177993 [Tanacetum coccineum]